MDKDDHTELCRARSIMIIYHAVAKLLGKGTDEFDRLGIKEGKGDEIVSSH